MTENLGLDRIEQRIAEVRTIEDNTRLCDPRFGNPKLLAFELADWIEGLIQELREARERIKFLKAELQEARDRIAYLEWLSSPDPTANNPQEASDTDGQK